ncbi:MAG: hypothetical protein RR757_04730 [Raoultibacter sp.]
MAKNIETGCQGVLAHVTYCGKKNGKTTLYAYPVDGATLQRIGDKRYQTTATTAADIPRCENELAVKAAAEYRNRRNTEVAKTQGRDGYFSRIFVELEDTSLLCADSWGPRTRHVALTYFSRQVLPRLDQYGPSIALADAAQIYTDLVAQAVGSKRGNRDIETAHRSVAAEWRQAMTIYANMRALLPDRDLPDLAFAPKTSHVQVESVKALPDKTRVTLAALCRLHIGEPVTMAVVLMLVAGLRPAEAAAALMGDICDRGDYGTYTVLYQVQNGERVPLLKTDNSYRTVVISAYGMAMYRLRAEYLRGQGYSEQRIAEMPCGGSPNHPEALATSSQISAAGKALLDLAGYSKDAWLAVAELMAQEPDEADGKELCGYSAYVLRRDYCTRAVQICGIEAEKIDYLLGHKTKQKNYDYNNAEVQAQIAHQLERYVFDPNYSRNPAFFKRVLDEKANHILPINARHRLTAQSPTSASLRIQTAEAGAAIRLVVPCGVVPQVAAHAVPDAPELRAARPLIGDVYCQSYYEAIIEKAEKIELERTRMENEHSK